MTSSESTHAESIGKRLTFDHAKNHYTMLTRYETVELVLEFIDGHSQSAKYSKGMIRSCLNDIFVVSIFFSVFLDLISILVFLFSFQFYFQSLKRLSISIKRYNKSYKRICCSEFRSNFLVSRFCF